MKYPAEIFDLIQYLFEPTGFNDHQLHCVIRFKDAVDEAAMEKAFRLILDAVPILKRVYRNRGGRSYWEDAAEPGAAGVFTVTESAEDFEAFTFSKTDAETGPQIKGCLYRGDGGALSIVMNHMAADGSGFKECVYLLSRMYTAVLKDPAWKPDFVLDGDRGYKRIVTGIKLRERLSILLFRQGDNNRPGDAAFPFSGGREVRPFIVTHPLPPGKLRDIVACSRENGATVNDVILAAYFRAMSAFLGLWGKTLSIPLMIDMRRYLEDKSFDAPVNLSSTEILRVAVSPGESFRETLLKLAGETSARKGNFFGLSSFIKLRTLFMLCGRGTAYRLLKTHLVSPNICITNIGAIDEGRLAFGGAEIDDVIVTGSIKYRPHFQMSLSSWGDRLTLAVNLYGNEKDREKINAFFSLMDLELEAAR